MSTGWFSPRLATAGWFRNLSPQAWFDERFLGAATGSPPSVSPWYWLDDEDDMLLRTNVAGQVVGAQLVSAADGSAFTGAVTCYVTVDGGTQATGSVGAGACTHEGNGYHTYAPAQAETNGVRLAYTFIGTGAVPRTVQATGVSFNPADATALGLSRLDAAISSRSSHAAADVWSVATRVLTAGTNIALAKGTGVTGFNDLDAAGVRSAVGLASANLDTQLAATATSANLATVAGYLDTEIAAILADTNELQTDWANGGRLDLILDARASQTSVDDLPTNAELATSQAAADDATLAAISALDGKVGTVTNLGSGATLAANLVDIENQTDDIGAAGAGLTALATAAELAKVPKSDGTATWNATALASLQQEATDALNAYDPPTNAEMTARTLASASYATAAALQVVDDELAAVDAVADAILVDTAEIGVAGAGLTNINLPDQTMNIVGNVTGNLSGSVGSVTAGVTVTTNNDKTGYAIGAGGIASAAFAAGAIDASALNASAVDEILDEAIGDGTVTLRQAMKLMVAVLGGKVTGAGTSSITFRNTADTIDVVVSAIDGVGNRTGVTLTL